MVEGPDESLLNAESHFAFGENWASYARGIGAAQIADAESGLRRLLGDEPLTGKRFLDIGCGSGLHALAALRLGASEVVAVDIDPASVATSRAVLAKHAPGTRYAVKHASVFELDSASWGQFDVVYSWGVLHHTGNLDRALRSAAALVAPGGLFVFALYRRTLSCGIWKLEKRWYAHAGPGTQKMLRIMYLTLFRAGLRVTGRRFEDYVSGYRIRGMDFHHDVHDWLGGFPYESISPRDVERKMTELALAQVRTFTRQGWFGRLFGIDHGVFGSGCDEYIYSRR